MRRKDSFLMQNVGGENFLIPIGSQVMDTNGILTLNATGSCIWELLAQERSLDELAAVVAERFDVEPKRARADVLTFLDEIGKLGLLAQ